MQISLPSNQLYLPDYEAEKSRCIDFITTFQDPRLPEDPIHSKLKYQILMQRVANKESKLIGVDLEDIKEFFSATKDLGFVERLLSNTARYVSLIAQVIDQHMPMASVNFKEEDLSTFDVIMQQRKHNMQTAQQERIRQGLVKPGNDAEGGRIPPELERTYQVVIVQGESAKKKICKMREVRAQAIGSLVTLKGIVTRASDVKPCMTVAVYACDMCGFEVYQIINAKEFNPKVECPSDKCIKNNVKGQLILQIKSSRFVSYQEIKIQEPSDQVPIGHVPRTMSILARGEITRLASPGDIVTITGVFMPSPYYGFRKAGLFQDTYVEAFEIRKEKTNFRETFLSEERMERVADIRGTCENDKHLFTRLAQSICPEIFGMTEVKQALLLLMVGGVTKEMSDGMKIRGNVNVLLMGDPGVAKSQLLKHIANFAPRGIYTTGKGSSGVGLTAAVMKDPVTNELVLEGGALVLADTGICAIDEFDKMDERDRTNIHEVMEQQTVSIAKAGITTSLNARTSVLAAANPLYGRYNPALKPHENINLPAALLSRFDLIFLLLDTHNEEMDEKLAFHVASVHRNLRAPDVEVEANNQSIDQDVMRAFIAHAQSFDPVIPPSLHNYIVAKYVEKRKFQREGKDEQSYMYVTPRTLLGIIRISQSMAKLNFRSEVKQSDVDEALMLMDFSFRSLRRLSGKPDQRRKARAADNREDHVSQIMRLVREVISLNGNVPMAIAEILKRLKKSNAAISLSREELVEILDYYKKLQVVYVDPDDQVIFL